MEGGWKAVLSNTKIVYLRRGNDYRVLCDDWILPEYLEQAIELCGLLGVSAGPTAGSTAMRLFQFFLQKPIGTCFSLSSSIYQTKSHSGGRAEVGIYGDRSPSDLEDVDFSSAYGTLLGSGPGDVSQINCQESNADIFDADISDETEFPIIRASGRGRSFFVVSKKPVRRLLTSAELALCKVHKVHCSYRLERRRDVARFAEVLMSLRDKYPVCKLLVNSLVGRLAVERNTAWSSVSTPKSGDTYICPGVFAREVPSKPHGAMLVYFWITGTCRGWLTKLLRSCTPICWDTDGAALYGLPECDRWGPFKLKRKECQRIEVFASKVSILTSENNVSVRSGGIPGEPSAEVIRRELSWPTQDTCEYVKGMWRRRDAIWADSLWLGRGLNRDGSTYPYDLRQIGS